MEELKLMCLNHKICYDNKETLSIAHNPIHHDHTEHVEIDMNFMKQKIDSKEIIMILLPSKQVAYMFTKEAVKQMFEDCLDKLTMEDLFLLAQGGVLKPCY